MVTDVVKLDIKIKGEDLAFDEITEVIVSELEGMIAHLRRTDGNIQNFKGDDDTSTIEYVHLKTSELN